MIRAYFYNGVQDADRIDLFNVAYSSFAEVDSTQTSRLLETSESTDPFVLFIHITHYSDAPTQISKKWVDDLKNSGVLVFYSGGGISDSEARGIEASRRERGFDGRIFVHRPAFDGPGGSIDKTIDGIQHFLSAVQLAEEQSGTLAGARFIADQMGWPGISESCHIEYSLSLLDALLPTVYDRWTSTDEPEALFRLLESLVESAQRSYPQVDALSLQWNVCQECFSCVVSRAGNNSSCEPQKLIALRNALLGFDSEMGLIGLLDQVWGCQSP